ncbi:hypothetical protein DL89DRAFT_265925 [Linderina pennispora]|uniref:Uncharacterized protein n=1 Tax=Linderina pennispora TaxID=61395 RepID=A0A1Y1WFR5_9FUNG|nr:uncharacterized protein DL89DRAFT_265925 [Linderina pennispora]ORX72337.1 hypothetical protein DL89DRAFT_265925 [Linderina pennispora]
MTYDTGSNMDYYGLKDANRSVSSDFLSDGNWPNNDDTLRGASNGQSTPDYSIKLTPSAARPERQFPLRFPSIPHTDVDVSHIPTTKYTFALKLLRMVNTGISALLISVILAMEIYMLLNQRGVIIIPLFVCRLILVGALVVLVLCDWAVLPKMFYFFPMYDDNRSWKGLGFSQIVVAFFVLGDSTLVGMQSDEGRFAKVLFPCAVTFGCLMVGVGITYFVAGVIGGARLKVDRKERKVFATGMEA